MVMICRCSIKNIVCVFFPEREVLKEKAKPIDSYCALYTHVFSLENTEVHEILRSENTVLRGGS